MRRIKEEADKTRQAILEAALTVFSKQGYHPARLQDIAEAADVTRGAIYHYFNLSNYKKKRVFAVEMIVAGLMAFTTTGNFNSFYSVIIMTFHTCIASLFFNNFPMEAL